MARRRKTSVTVRTLGGGIVRGLQRGARRILGVGRMSWTELWTTLAGWASIGLGAEVTRPMAQSVHVFRAVNAIATTLAAGRLVLRRGGEGEPITRGPAFELMSRPYPGDTTADLLEQIAGHICTSGAAFLVDPDFLVDPLRRLDRPGPPRRLVVVGQKQMRPQYGATRDELLWWNYMPRGGGVPLPVLPEFAPYLRLWNPDDDWVGLSPLEAAALGIKQDYQSALFNVAALENGGAVGGFVSLPDDPGEERRREYLRLLEERHQGPERANRLGLLWGGADWKQTAWTMADMQLIEARKLSREEIFEALGVPPILGMVFEAAHYNVGDSAQEIFLLNTVAPLARKVADLLTHVVLPAVEPGVTAEIDLTEHPVMQRVERGKYDSLGKLMSWGVPYNESIRALRLPFAEQEWGKRSLLGAGLITVEDVLAGLQAPPEEPEGQDEDDSGARAMAAAPGRMTGGDAGPPREQAAASEQRRWNERLVRAAMPRIARRFRALFVRQERELQRRLRRVLAAAGARPASAPSRRDPSIPSIAAPSEEEAKKLAQRILLDLGEEQRKLRGLVRQYFPETVTESLRAELQRLGVAPGKIRDLVDRLARGRWITRVLRVKENKIVGLERVTRRRIEATLVQGIKGGETAQQLADRIHGVLGGNRARALTIARTEASQAVSTGQFMAQEAAGAKAKGWIHGNNPRGTHVLAARRYAPATGAIPFSEPFEVGSDQLLYPCDPMGSPGEIINCNCTLVPVRRPSQEAAA